MNSELYMCYSRRDPDEFSITRFWWGNSRLQSLRQLEMPRFGLSIGARPRRCVSTKETDFKFSSVSLTRVVMIIMSIRAPHRASVPSRTKLGFSSKVQCQRAGCEGGAGRGSSMRNHSHVPKGCV